MTPTIFFTRGLFPPPTAIRSLGPLGSTGGLLGAGLAGGSFGLWTALRTTLGTLGTSTSVPAAVASTATTVTAVTTITAPAGAGSFAATTGGRFATAFFPVPALEGVPELVFGRIRGLRLSLFRFADLRWPRFFASRGALSARSPFRFWRFLSCRSGLPWRTAGACRLWLGLNQPESEVIVLGGVVARTARFGGPDDGHVLLRLGSCRFCGWSNGFRLDVEAVEVEGIVVDGGRSQPSGAAEEIVCERLPIVVGALLLKWIVHGVTLSLACGEFKIPPASEKLLLVTGDVASDCPRFAP
jgi:hypothetical protein